MNFRSSKWQERRNSRPDAANAHALARKEKAAAVMRDTASPLEVRFMRGWEVIQGPELQREFAFHLERRWRFDFAHLASRTAIELEGGVWTGGRHTTGAGFVADCEKYNAATLAGWAVFRLPNNLCDLPTMGQIATFISNRTPRNA